MNNKIKLLACSMVMLFTSEIASADAAYLQKFQTYQKYAADLPAVDDQDFLNFISIPSPLTNKLREKMLYKLAKEKDWQNYNKLYHPSDDVSLQCYAQQARLEFNRPLSKLSAESKLRGDSEHRTGVYTQVHEDSSTESTKQVASADGFGMRSNAKSTVIHDILPIWLTGTSQPEACTEVFNILLSDKQTRNKYINQRVSKALEQRNYSLANYLLKKSNPGQEQKLKLLNLIQHNPRKISLLLPGELNGDLYLYGLKKIAHNDPKLAVRLFNRAKDRGIINEQQQQSFLVHFALYKAIRNKDDAPFWLAKVNKEYYTEKLTDWQIRYAIAHKNWQQLLNIIATSPEKESARLKYWQARAYAGLGNTIKANEIYAEISSKRNYYAFLASNKLKLDLSLMNEQIIYKKDVLNLYKPITDEIKNLYDTHKILQASRMINDFSSELGKSELGAFAHWVAKELNWNGKSIYLCNNDDLFNQLSLRFPLAYKDTILANSKRYQVAVPLIYAIIRQESAFFENISSSAGAAGLMQVMPQTAKQVAKKSQIPYKGQTELFTAPKNINIGVAYLKQLSDKFDDNMIFMIAAYNAGPHQVNHWLQQNSHKEMDIWIETIPWAETRNYVKNVIAFYAIYQYRLYNKPSLSELKNYL